MVEDISWEAFKEFRINSFKQQDNFMMLIDFLKSHYNLFSVHEIYDSLNNDETAKKMLEKRGLNTLEDFETFLFKAK